MGYVYIFCTILFTVVGQLMMKWRVSKYGAIPVALHEKLHFLLKLFCDPFIIASFVFAFAASIFWIGAMTKFEISYAYPFMSLSFVIVFFVSIFLFQESMSWMKIIGLLLIVSGIIVTSRSL